MQDYGILKIRLFVAAQLPDQHGRLNGGWKTLLNKWAARDEVDQLLENFKTANPWLQPVRNDLDLDVAFTITEHFTL